MELMRKIRKKTTIELLRFGQYVATKGSYQTVERLRTIMRLFFRVLLPLRLRLRTNIRCAGLEPDGLIDAYFDRGIDQMIMVAHGFRADFDMNMLTQQFIFDETFEILEQTYAKGKGVITITPHISGYPVYGAIISSRIPCTIYQRRNQDPRKMKITETVAKSSNAELISPPVGATKAQRLQVAIDALRQGKMLFLTPDTPRKPEDGVAVEILGKTAHFPTGVFIMSMRTGAPVLPVWWYWKEGYYHVSYGQPIELQRGGGLRQKAETAMKEWGAEVDAFIRTHPEMWWNWLDKRWTKILRNGSL
jgi:lauroyl/myristoyl acyltransferase